MDRWIDGLSPNTGGRRGEAHLLPRQRVSLHGRQQVLRALGQRVSTPDITNVVTTLQYDDDDDDDDDDTCPIHA